jgi:hypothetical protein
MSIAPQQRYRATLAARAVGKEVSGAGSGREAEHAVLLIPFSWGIDQSSQSDAAGQPALDRGLN